MAFGSTFEAFWGLDSIAASVDLIKLNIHKKIFLVKVQFGHFRDTYGEHFWGTFEFGAYLAGALYLDLIAA